MQFSNVFKIVIQCRLASFSYLTCMTLKFGRFCDDIIKRMVQKAQVRSVLRTSQCQPQERVRKHEGLRGIQIPMSSSHEVLRSNTQRYSVFFYRNFCLKYFFPIVRIFRNICTIRDKPDTLYIQLYLNSV